MCFADKGQPRLLLEVNKILIYFYIPADRNTDELYLTAQFLFQQNY